MSRFWNTSAWLMCPLLLHSTTGTAKQLAKPSKPLTELLPQWPAPRVIAPESAPAYHRPEGFRLPSSVPSVRRTSPPVVPVWMRT